MDPSAARPVQKRYVAGGCRLDITLRPSALSQWTPRPVAQTLAFKLWLETPADAAETQQTSPVLVAEGDQETLQAIAHYIAQQTRSALTLAYYGDGPTRALAPCPPSFHWQPPLSYLQLCDLTAVFNQVEQATYLLPVPLTASEATSKSNGRLIPFPANRKLWASSAAAALLAVGLTTALWPRSAEQDAAKISDASPVDPAAPIAEPEPPQNAAPRSEAVPTKPESAIDNSLSATPMPSIDIRPAPTVETLPLPSAESSVQPQAEAQIEAQAEAQTEAHLETQADPPDLANDPATTNTPTIPAQSAARQSAARAPNQNDQISPSAAADLPATESDIIAQVQRYFQAQWQASAQDVQLPLVYQLQLSSSGEVIRLVGLSDAAQTYSDRLLPPTPLTFSHSADQPLTLRLTLTADGIVEVSKP